MLRKQKIEKSIEDLHDFVIDYQFDVKLRNAQTHETVVPDPAAIKAGFLAALVTIGCILDGKYKTGSNKERYECLNAALVYAGKKYLDETLPEPSEETDVVEHG